MFHRTYILVVKATFLEQNNNTTNLCAVSSSVCQQVYFPTHSSGVYIYIPSDNNVVITHSPSIVHRRFNLILSYSFLSPDCCGACENVASSGKFVQHLSLFFFNEIFGNLVPRVSHLRSWERGWIFGIFNNYSNKSARWIWDVSIITQVIIEILALSLAENGVIFRHNHLRRGDYSGRTNFIQNSRLARCQCIWRGN